jgi:hypothetical protein
MLVLIFFEANQFRGDQDKKKGKSKARDRRALAVTFEISDLRSEIFFGSIGNGLQTRPGIHCRQSDAEYCSVPGRAFDTNVAGMLLNNAI